MRPTPGRADADSHLWPCPQCGSANGLNARACWNCDATLDVPAEDELPEPISAALTAQGMRIPEIPMAPADAAADEVAVDERPASSARRRSLFEAAIARMNGEPDDPSDRWDEYSGEWPAPVEPMRTEVDATFAAWSNEEARLARRSAAERSGGPGAADQASPEAPSAEAPSIAEPFPPGAPAAAGEDPERSADDRSSADTTTAWVAQEAAANGSSATDASAAGASTTDASTADTPTTDVSTSGLSANPSAAGDPTSDPSWTSDSSGADREPGDPSAAGSPAADASAADSSTFGHSPAGSVPDDATMAGSPIANPAAEAQDGDFSNDASPHAESPTSDPAADKPDRDFANGASPHAESPTSDSSHTESPPWDAAADEEPKAASFADTPFDAKRFAVKSFDAWRSPEDSAEAEAWNGEAPDLGTPLPHAGAVEAGISDPATAVDAFGGSAASDRDAPAGDSSAAETPAPLDVSASSTRSAADKTATTGTAATPATRLATPFAGSDAVPEPPPTARPADSSTARRDDPVPPADLAAALTPIDDSLPPRWPSKSGRRDSDAPLWPHAIVAESDPPPSTTSIETAAPSAAPPTPPFIVASDPPFLTPNDPPLGGTPSTGAAAGRAKDLPPISADAPFVAPLPDPTAAKRRAKKSRSREESAIQTFEDSFFAAGSHPPIHSDDDASFDSSRSGRGSTHPPVRGGRDSDAFGPLPSARAERTSDALRDESLGERFAALASTSAQAARRRRRVTIATLCAVLVAVVLGAYPFFGDGVRIDLSFDELRSAASMSSTPLAPAAVAPSPESTTKPADTRSAGRTELPAPAMPATATPTAPTPPARMARSEERSAPPAQVPAAQPAQAQAPQTTSAGGTRPARVPREVAERLARRQAEATRTPAEATVAPTAERSRIDANRARAEAARSRSPVEGVGAADEAPPIEARANRRRAAAEETAADSGGSITCTERILALNLCGPSTRKE